MSCILSMILYWSCTLSLCTGCSRLFPAFVFQTVMRCLTHVFHSLRSLMGKIPSCEVIRWLHYIETSIAYYRMLFCNPEKTQLRREELSQEKTGLCAQVVALLTFVRVEVTLTALTTENKLQNIEAITFISSR